jgi:RNA polymerase-binding transcription factor DksA
MSRSSALPTQSNLVLEPFPDYRTLLEEHWRRQVTTITELSYAALSPLADEPDDDGSRTTRFQVTARLIAAARRQLQETEAALAQVGDGSAGLCRRCGDSLAARPADPPVRRVMRRLPGPALAATVGEEQE